MPNQHEGRPSPNGARDRRSPRLLAPTCGRLAEVHAACVAVTENGDVDAQRPSADRLFRGVVSGSVSVLRTSSVKRMPLVVSDAEVEDDDPYELEAHVLPGSRRDDLVAVFDLAQGRSSRLVILQTPAESGVGSAVHK